MNNVTIKTYQTALSLLSHALMDSSHALELMDKGLGIPMDSFLKKHDETREQELYSKIRSGEYSQEEWNEMLEVSSRNSLRKKKKLPPSLSDKLAQCIEDMSHVSEKLMEQFSQEMISPPSEEAHGGKKGENMDNGKKGKNI